MVGLRRILVATDGSDLAAKAQGRRAGVSFAKEIGAKITAVTVTEPFHLAAKGGPEPIPRDSARRRRQRVERSRVGRGFLFGKAHRREKRGASVGWLPGLKDVALQAAAGERVAH